MANIISKVRNLGNAILYCSQLYLIVYTYITLHISAIPVAGILHKAVK